VCQILFFNKFSEEKYQHLNLRNYRKKAQSPIGHYTHTAENVNGKVQTFNMGNNITCAINCKNRIKAIIHTLETWFVSGV
jgi:hypothetical protein